MKDTDFSQAIQHFPLAMTYTPWQSFANLYELEKALKIGTIFPELDKPFVGRRCVK